MPALWYDINESQGIDYSETFEWSPGGILANLTGYTAVLKIRSATNTAAPAVLTLSNGSGITLGGVLGTVRVAITAAQMLAIAQGNYYYDLVLTSAGGIKYKFVEGNFVVRFTVSQ